MSSVSPAGHSWKSRAKHGFAKPWIKNILLILLILFVCGTLGLLGLFAYVSRDLPDPNALTRRTVKQSTKIYDRTGDHLLYEIFGNENRTLVKVQRGFCAQDASLPTDPQGIPLISLQATIAAEDRAFCSHYGFTLKGLARALLFGGSRGGGSTLTQQLVKNAILSNEKTLTRKVKELILSVELERRYTKDEILQIYFNEIPYGSTYYGIQAASMSFYGKPAHALTLAEAATLAAIPQLPTYYINNPDKLRIRRDWILETMADLGYITKDQAAEAKKTNTPLKERIGSIEAPHFVLSYVKPLLEQEFGRQTVEEGGLSVITSLDYDLQKKAEEIVAKGVEDRGKIHKFSNAALVAMDPKTGQVLAMVGSKNYFGKVEPEGCQAGKTCTFEPNTNVALRARQPGSSFKPIVYTKAFSMGYTPNTITWDVNTVFPSAIEPYAPHDYDLKERGPITIRNALQGSLNIPAVEMMYLAGVDHVLDFADAMGYTTFSDRSRFGLAVVLGGGEVTLLEHVNAYAAIDNDGVRHDTTAILKVTDAQGVVLQEWQPSEGTQIVEPNVARMTSDVLSDNAARSYIFGLNSPLQLGDRPAAAKSGTTNFNVDAWAMGYVPSLVTGVWVGNNDNSKMGPKADGSVVAMPIWNAFMKAALQNKPVEAFQKPEIPLTGKPILDGQMPGTRVTIDRASGKLATEYTPPSFREERLYAEYHSLLHYVDPADPLAPVPSNPQNDPVYKPWEDAIQDWIRRGQEATGIILSNIQPPTTLDDMHVPANMPSVSFVFPSEGISLENRLLDMAAVAGAPRGISRVEFYADGKFIGVDTSVPYELHTRAPSALGRGTHTLKAIAYDDIDNSQSTSVHVSLMEDAVGGTIDISDPKDSQFIVRDVGTYKVVISLPSPANYSVVNVYAQRVGGAERSLVGSKSAPDSPFTQINWPLPNDGDWILTASASLKSGAEPLTTAGILVHVRPGSASTSNAGTSLSPFPPLVSPPVVKTP